MILIALKYLYVVIYLKHTHGSTMSHVPYVTFNGMEVMWLSMWLSAHQHVADVTMFTRF